jgi:large conductance mechanosensitive channel
MKGFLEFVRQQGVVGLAVGFVLGGAVAKLVSSLVVDIINPLLGIALGATSGLKEAYIMVGPAKVLWGDFAATFLDFCVISFVVYIGVTKTGLLEKLDKKK